MRKLALLAVLIVILASCGRGEEEREVAYAYYEIAMQARPEHESLWVYPTIRRVWEYYSTIDDSMPIYGTNWQVIVAPIFHEIGEFIEEITEPVALVRLDDYNGNEQWGVINTAGYFVVQPIFCEIGDIVFRYDALHFAAVRKNGYWGVISGAGQILVPLEFPRLRFTDYDFVITYVPNQPHYLRGFYLRGLFDLRTGEEIKLPVFSSISIIAEDIISANDGVHFQHFNREGQQILMEAIPHQTTPRQTPSPPPSIPHIGGNHLQYPIFREWDGERYLFGVESWSGHEIAPAIYDAIVPFSSGIAAVGIGDPSGSIKWGLLNGDGEIILPIEYSEIATVQRGISRVRKGEYWGFINEDGTFEVPMEIPFDWVDYRPCAHGRILIEHNRRLGIIQLQDPPIQLTPEQRGGVNWTLLTEPIFASATPFVYGTAAVQTGGRWEQPRWELIDKHGNFLPTPPTSDEITQRRRGTFHQTEEAGLRAADIPTDSAVEFLSETRVLIVTEITHSGRRLYSLANIETGELFAQLPWTYNRVYPFANGLAIIRAQTSFSNRFGVIDYYGNEIISPSYSYENIRIFDEFIVTRRSLSGNNQMVGIYNHQGEMIYDIRSPAERVHVGQTTRGILVRRFYNNTVGLIGTDTMRVSIPTGLFTEIHEYAYGVAVVSVGGYGKNRRMGLIEVATGRMIIPTEKTEIRILCQDMIAVRHGGQMIWDDDGLRAEGGQVGIINREGEEIAPPIFRNARPFSQGIAIVENQDGQGLINQMGEIILPLEFASIEYPEHDLAQINKGRYWSWRSFSPTITYGYWGIINRSGNIVVPPTMPFAWVGTPSPEGIATIEHNGRVGFIQIDPSPIEYIQTNHVHVSELPEAPQISTLGDLPRYGTNWRLVTEPIYQCPSEIDIQHWSRERDFSNYGMQVILERVGESYRQGVKEIETGRIIVEPINIYVWVLCPYMIAVMPEGETKYDEWYQPHLIGKWGIIDANTGQEIAPVMYDAISSFSHGIAKVFIGEHPLHPRWEPFVGQWELMNREGEIILPIEYNEITTWRGGLMRANRGGHFYWALGMDDGAYFETFGGYWGFLNHDGTWAVPPEIPFDWVGHPCPNGLVMIEQDRRLGIIQIEF